MRTLDGLEPERVFYYFEEICGIPHGSGNTGKISDYCVAFAKKMGLRYRQDEYHNVIIWKSGTKGYENSAPVILQGHLDMVCEKEPDCDIHFETDGLKLRVDDGMISAEGTTLGGDDGIAVAFALAILEADTIEHPPLEIILTTEEEIGMTGANNLEFSDVKSRIMLNLDSEDEGYFLVGCAGGVTVNAEVPVEWEEAGGQEVSLAVTGLQGGHSGVEIDKGRGSACQLLGRVLYRLRCLAEVHIRSVSGGNKDNAIPREAKALLLVKAEEWERIKAEVQKLREEIKREYAVTDPNIELSVRREEGRGTARVMSKWSADVVTTMLVDAPYGVQRMSPDIKGLVQTSLNLGILKSGEDAVTYSFSVRSSLESEKTTIVERLKCLAETLGGTVYCTGDYPAWEYRSDSPLRELMIETYRKMFGSRPVVQLLHAGLECGIFSERLPGLDCVSYGPDIKEIHTTEEAMSIESVKRTWEYTLEVLKNLK